jgi:hypothetical protein
VPPTARSTVSGRYPTPLLASVVIGVPIVALAWVYLAFSGEISRHGPAGPPRTRCHPILRAGLASQVVHSGRYPCRLQNGTDNGLACS